MSEKLESICSLGCLVALFGVMGISGEVNLQNEVRSPEISYIVGVLPSTFEESNFDSNILPFINDGKYVQIPQVNQNNNFYNRNLKAESREVNAQLKLQFPYHFSRGPFVGDRNMHL